MKKAKVLISVIIPTYNEEKNIGRLLSSLAQQTFKDFEIIVVDNYSTDKTRQIAQKFTNKVYELGPERSHQRNYGLKRARGKYILFVDADMELEKSTLEECVNKMENDQKLAGIIINEVSVGQGFLAKIKALEKKLYQDQPLIEAPRFFRTAKIKLIGGFDEDLVAGEEWDLGNRLGNLGNFAKVAAKIYHWESHSLIKDISKKYYYAKHIKKYAAKHQLAFRKQASILFRFSILFSKPKLILTSPAEFLGLLILKSAQYFAFLLAKKN